ncbi:MAG: protein kinase [Myxococcales bacterium]|nr:protein kinase [Myxococcales bacterium]
MDPTGSGGTEDAWPDDQVSRTDSGDGAPAPVEVPGHLGESARIGRFAVLRQLGAGGMGVVYSAYDEELDRKIALKLLRPGRDNSDRNQARMQREARAMATLSHPNVVQVYEVGRFEDQVYLAMEFVPGKTLGAWLKAPRPEGAPPLSWQQILDVMIQAGQGLHAAHEAGVVHGDFKPDNVLIDAQDRAHVVDFGLSRRVDPAESAARHPRLPDEAALSLITTPQPGQPRRHEPDPEAMRSSARIAGTPAYMAPEQHRHRPADQRADQFSFCVTLYIALYGRHPFAGEGLLALVMNVCDGNVHPPDPASPVPPAIFHQVIARGLDTEPERRFATMADLLEALGRASGRARDPEFDLSVARRQRIVLSAAIALSAIGITVVFVLTSPTDDRMPTASMSVTAALVVNLVILTLLFAFRGALLKNTINRRVMAWLVVSSLSILVHRVSALAIDISVTATLVNDLLLLSFIAFMAAVTVERWIAGAGLLMFGACVTIAAVPAIAPLVLVGATLGVFGLATYFWHRR